MLSDMGFTSAQAKKALRETVSIVCVVSLLINQADHSSNLAQDGNAERAVEWLFSHPDDTGEEVVTPSKSKSGNFGGSKDLPAKYRLKAFVSHKGPSVHSGHYVATIRKFNEQGQEEWVLFNDEKVVKAEGQGTADLMSKAYLYVYERV